MSILKNIARAAAPAMKRASAAPIFTEEWALKFTTEKEAAPVSPWHDIPLLTGNGNALNYVNEIAIGTKAKMEVATKVEYNPIMQDIKKGKLRYFTYGDIPFNYGCLPRTWEDPSVGVADCGGAAGDNDPLDVCDLSGKPMEIGAVTPVKALAVLAMIDEGETDWKLIVLPDTEEYAAINNLKDLQRDANYNQKLADVLHWFRYYKTTDGKPENTFGFNSEFQDESYALKVIEETSEQYEALVNGTAENKKNLWVPKSA
eukprot:TRINITY_DN3227_c0_g3_i1.p1 TRINITY_DN3227_c0_g3~~TRINITY_DN3227_c0_g3_i1.p1  ORF type:complete len:259 (+),score=149.97 TRINITY_DN3227_c0_g3_i1:65-841(+)